MIEKFSNVMDGISVQQYDSIPVTKLDPNIFPTTYKVKQCEWFWVFEKSQLFEKLFMWLTKKVQDLSPWMEIVWIMDEQNDFIAIENNNFHRYDTYKKEYLGWTSIKTIRNPYNPNTYLYTPILQIPQNSIMSFLFWQSKDYLCITEDNVKNYNKIVPDNILYSANANKDKFDNIVVLDAEIVPRHNNYIRIDDTILCGKIDGKPNTYFYIASRLNNESFETYFPNVFEEKNTLQNGLIWME